MKKYFPQESRAFLQTEYAKAGTIASLLRQIPEQRKTEALLQFQKLRYSAFDLDFPFLEQFQRNQEKLIEVLSQMADKNK